METCFTHNQDLAKMILAWFPFGMGCKWRDGSAEIALYVVAPEAVSRSWHLACKSLTEKKAENIAAGTVEDVDLVIIFFDSHQLSFRKCIREASAVWEGIRKVRTLIIVLYLFPERALEVLGQWLLQVHARHAGDVIRIKIDIPLGLYILDRRRTIGFKMRRLHRAPASLNAFRMFLLHMGVQLESIDYCSQHWEQRANPLDFILGSDFVEL